MTSADGGVRHLVYPRIPLRHTPRVLYEIIHSLLYEARALSHRPEQSLISGSIDLFVLTRRATRACVLQYDIHAFVIARCNISSLTHSHHPAIQPLYLHRPRSLQTLTLALLSDLVVLLTAESYRPEKRQPSGSGLRFNSSAFDANSRIRPSLDSSS
jgi:hypothetical protein